MDIHAGKHGHTLNWDKMDIQARMLELSFSGHMVIAFRKVIFYSEYLSYSWSSMPQIDTFHMREVEARSRRKTGQDSVTKVATGMTTALGGRGRAPPVLATPAGAVTRHWRPPGGGARS